MVQIWTKNKTREKTNEELLFIIPYSLTILKKKRHFFSLRDSSMVNKRQRNKVKISACKKKKKRTETASWKKKKKKKKQPQFMATKALCFTRILNRVIYLQYVDASSLFPLFFSQNATSLLSIVAFFLLF